MRKEGFSRREFLAGLAGAATVGAAAELTRRALTTQEEPSPEPTERYAPVERNEFFDGNPEYLSVVTQERGEWTREQRKARRRTLLGGEEIFDDVGLSFYLVKKGDTISEIRARLGKYPEFAHLPTQGAKLDSFNIPAKKLREGMWIPIPVESADRQLTEAQFVSYTNEAITQMRDDRQYGEEVRRILEKVSQRELVATMIAIAKQEGGGLPLGQFELHRWESHQQAFSFSFFHVLMKGPGLRARRAFNLTEGQLYHPLNAVKLFLGFLVEKNSEVFKHADRLFPIWDHEEAFARFYNGNKWKKTNPQYLENVREYYDQANAYLSKDGTRWLLEPVPLPPPVQE